MSSLAGGSAFAAPGCGGYPIGSCVGGDYCFSNSSPGWEKASKKCKARIHEEAKPDEHKKPTPTPTPTDPTKGAEIFDRWGNQKS